MKKLNYTRIKQLLQKKDKKENDIEERLNNLKKMVNPNKFYYNVDDEY